MGYSLSLSIYIYIWVHLLVSPSPAAVALAVVCRVPVPVRGAHHVYDPVDQFALVPAGMDAILAQTTTAASDYANHPSVLAQDWKSRDPQQCRLRVQ